MKLQGRVAVVTGPGTGLVGRSQSLLQRLVRRWFVDFVGKDSVSEDTIDKNTAEST
jgi:hypothetical protein